MLKYKQIKVNGKNLEAIYIRLQNKSFILIRGSRGYIMCGYLNMSVANKFKDVAIKIVGVASIEEALKAKVYSVSAAAARLGIFKGQVVKEVLRRIV